MINNFIHRVRLLSIACLLTAIMLYPTQVCADESIQLPAVKVMASPLDQQQLQAAQPVTVLRAQALQRKRQISLGDTLSNELGVTSSSFGPAAGRPIIRGLDGPRIKVMENGIDALDLSSISPDHAVSIDTLNATQIEILRGPATLLYGGGATGGVVNVVSNQIPERLFKSINGGIEIRGNTATVERSGALNLMGSAGPISLSFGGFKRKSRNYDIPGRANKNDPLSKRGVVENSATDSEGVSVGASYIGSRGFIGASFARLENEYGVPSPERPSINLRQSRFNLAGELENPIIGFEKARVLAGYNDYQHDEIEASGEVGTQFKNNGVESRLELSQAPIFNWRGVWGVQFRYHDFSAIGEEAVVPPTESHSTGFFVVEEHRWNAFQFEVGGRIELAKQDPKSGEGERFSRTFNLFSGSVGTSWEFVEGYTLGLFTTRGQRAPTTEELFSHGAHAATVTFDVGGNALKKETSHNIDFSLSKTQGALQWKVNAFYNRFNNYIFRSSLDANQDGVADRVDEMGVFEQDGEFLVQNFAQTDATFYGVEAEVKLEVMPENLDARLFTDYVRSKLDQNGNTPRIPPLRFGFELNPSMGPWSGNLNIMHVIRQGDVARLETETSGYTLFNVEASYRFVKTQLGSARFFVQGNNLLNETIRMHTSFLKDFAPRPGRAIVAGIHGAF